jgi:uncharacterized protein involved in exopolysaccharide biosynthesis
MQTTSRSSEQTAVSAVDSAELEGPGLLEIAKRLTPHWRILLALPLLVGAVAWGASHLIPPTFTATTTVIPPQQGQSAAATAMASLGSLAGLVGGSAGRSSGEQYVALMQSVTVSDRVAEKFNLKEVYGKRLREEIRGSLLERVRVSFGKKDGLLTVQVDDTSPQRAADMANYYVEELRRLNTLLAVTEAQQRRAFFEQQLEQAKGKLLAAQKSLQTSGFNPEALKAEPKSAAETYARLKANVTTAEVRLQALRGSLTDTAPEVRQQQAALSLMREQLSKVEITTAPAGGADYISRFREFKYQETLFEMYARQFELARVDESREGSLIQVVDVAMPPEKKSKPSKTLIALLAAAASLLLLVATLLVLDNRSLATRQLSSRALL